MAKVVMILSGGLDSTVLAYALVDAGHEVHALGVNYGQRHSKELTYATETAQRLGFSFLHADVAGIRSLLRSSQTTESIPVPNGHYAEESMKATVVPNRNAIMLNIALGHAQSIKAAKLYYGAHTGDHAIYPDCRPVFVDAMRVLARVSDYHEVGIEAPFIEKTKADIVKLGIDLNVPFESTWSCYKGAQFHCGQCGTCVERIEAFDIARVPDPTIYQVDRLQGTIYQLRECGVLPLYGAEN